jgi:predicted amidophosphoribosyltransferase
VISSSFGITPDTDSLIKVRHTERHRAGIDAIDRARSIEKAFEVVEPRLINGASILLIDDVYTTGSTTLEAVKTLLEAGAQQVSIFTVARVATPLHK